MQECSADESGIDLVVDIGWGLDILLPFFNESCDIITQQTKTFLGIADDYTFAVSPHTSGVTESSSEI